tara:strand:- start:507 stop:884 length:378 start_codon:yes stop_codon:yes gene_type:complete
MESYSSLELGRDIFKVEYQGKIISTNELKSKSWRKMKPKIDALKLEFFILIQNANLPKFKGIELKVRYWSKHDVDNISSTIKIFVDQLVKAGKIKDDNKNYWKKLIIEADETLKNNTLIFEIKKL